MLIVYRTSHTDCTKKLEPLHGTKTTKDVAKKKRGQSASAATKKVDFTANSFVNITVPCASRTSFSKIESKRCLAMV
jgi:hypothetical protein